MSYINGSPTSLIVQRVSSSSANHSSPAAVPSDLHSTCRPCRYRLLHIVRAWYRNIMLPCPARARKVREWANEWAEKREERREKREERREKREERREKSRTKPYHHSRNVSFPLKKVDTCAYDDWIVGSWYVHSFCLHFHLMNKTAINSQHILMASLHILGYIRFLSVL